MTPTAITLNQTRLMLDPRGALYWPDRDLLAVADLHFEKGSHFATMGVPLPPHDTARTLDAVAALLADWRPRTMVCLGDSFHDSGAGGRMAAGDRDRLTALTAAHDWVWITGNHDGDAGLAFGGRARAEWVVGGLCFRHEAETAAAPGEVSGHYHPKARVRHRGRSAGGRCFLADGKRLILPALGAFTGGLDATEPVFAPFFPKGFTAHILIRDRILSLPRGRLERPLRLRR